MYKSTLTPHLRQHQHHQHLLLWAPRVLTPTEKLGHDNWKTYCFFSSKYVNRCQVPSSRLFSLSLALPSLDHQVFGASSLIHYVHHAEMVCAWRIAFGMKLLPFYHRWVNTLPHPHHHHPHRTRWNLFLYQLVPWSSPGGERGWSVQGSLYLPWVVRLLPF